ncbi:hypothetical protein BDW66DRAFT_134282 [Aspergillus desertorum]
MIRAIRAGLLAPKPATEHIQNAAKWEEEDLVSWQNVALKASIQMAKAGYRAGRSETARRTGKMTESEQDIVPECAREHPQASALGHDGDRIGGEGDVARD